MQGFDGIPITTCSRHRWGSPPKCSQWMRGEVERLGSFVARSFGMPPGTVAKSFANSPTARCTVAAQRFGKWKYAPSAWCRRKGHQRGKRQPWWYWAKPGSLESRGLRMVAAAACVQRTGRQHCNAAHAMTPKEPHRNQTHTCPALQDLKSALLASRYQRSQSLPVVKFIAVATD